MSIDRIRGALLGVHAGDSLGASLEFTSFEQAWVRFPGGLGDIVGGVAFEWEPGAATDDTDLTLAVVDAYRVAHHDHDELVRAAADGMLVWFDGDPIDVGNATAGAMSAYRRDRDPTSSGLTGLAGERVDHAHRRGRAGKGRRRATLAGG